MTAPPRVLNPRHENRPVMCVEVDGRTLIRKQYRHGSNDVYEVMQALWASPLGAHRTCPGVPEPVGLDPILGSVDMAFIDGTPVSTRGTLGMLPDVLDDVAMLLADLHGSGVVVARRRDPGKVLRLMADRLALADLDIIDHLSGRAPEQETLCLNHGDFSPRNVIQTERGPVLIDLDRLQMAGPGRDVNHLGAWCWATIALGRDRSGVDAWDLCDAFEAAYLAHRPEAASDVVAGRSFHRATGLLRIATEWSAVTSDPTIQRRVLDEATRVARLTN